MKCKFCGAVLPEPEPGEIVRRKRAYCSDAHRQADYRRRKSQPAEPAASTQLQELLVEKEASITKLERTIQEQRQIIDQEQRKPKPQPLTRSAKAQIKELERQNAHLSFRLASSKHSRLKRYQFEPWLRIQSVTPFMVKLLGDLSEISDCPGTLPEYESLFRSFGYSDKDLQQFHELWDTMLKIRSGATRSNNVT